MAAGAIGRQRAHQQERFLFHAEWRILARLRHCLSIYRKTRAGVFVYSWPMANNLSFFSIHVDNLDRARAFYERVFGWRFEPWGPPGFYLIHTGDEKSPG